MILQITWFLLHWLLIIPTTIAAETTTVYRYWDKHGVLHLTTQKPPKQQKNYQTRSYPLPPTVIDSDTLLPATKPLPIAATDTISTTPSLPPLAKPASGDGNNTNTYLTLIATVAQEVGLSPALIQAMVEVESAYNPNAISPKGAVGLMQLMPATGERYGVTDRTEPLANLTGGARYMRDLLVLFDNKLTLALAAYNAGETTVKRYRNRIPPYQETRRYVSKVMKLYERYSKEVNN
jgi:soluble lytic murein transglycosylase-like protein